VDRACPRAAAKCAFGERKPGGESRRSNVHYAKFTYTKFHRTDFCCAKFHRAKSGWVESRFNKSHCTELKRAERGRSVRSAYCLASADRR
jgi:hypothetical protein